MAKDIDMDYARAREAYAAVGVDTERALERMNRLSLSLHCWQGDDIGGFETRKTGLGRSGIQVTGNHPGKARTVDELRADLKKAYSLIPGRHRLNLHAIYGEFGGRGVDRDAVGTEHFRGWLDWAREEELGLDFNCTCFSHPKADSGMTLSHKDPGIRKFWIAHVDHCRSISAWMGRQLGTPCLHNLWIPDGMKDVPMDRWAHRSLLRGSLDEIYARDFPAEEIRDSLESKLFGLGSEAFVVGSHEFYFGYALSRGKMVCLDLGHFHPTESVADKISAVLPFFNGLVLHISRGVRWDSDHVVILNDDLRDLTGEVVRSGRLDDVRFALDFFDASLSRIGAWVIGARATLKGLLSALLEPTDLLRSYEEQGNGFRRLALLEELKDLPFGAVWNHHCASHDVPLAEGWMSEVDDYDARIIGERV